MSLRILTGVLVPPAANQVGGPHTATINFNPHGVAGAAAGVDLNERGDNGDFDAPPGSVLAIRQADGGGQITIDNGPLTVASMDVQWTVGVGASLQEISYMIVGEA